MIPEAQVCSDTYRPLALAPLATELFEEERSSGPALSTERFGASQLLVLAQLCSGLAGTLSTSTLIFIHPFHSSVPLRFRATPTPTSTSDRMTINYKVYGCYSNPSRPWICISIQRMKSGLRPRCKCRSRQNYHSSYIVFNTNF